MSREAIYAGLFALVTNDPGVQAVVKFSARSLRHFDDVPAESCPALYLLQVGENWVRPGKGVPPKRTLEARFVLYTLIDPTSGLQATTVNTVLDAIDNALIALNPSGAVVLGGLVERV